MGATNRRKETRASRGASAVMKNAARPNLSKLRPGQHVVVREKAAHALGAPIYQSAWTNRYMHIKIRSSADADSASCRPTP